MLSGAPKLYHHLKRQFKFLSYCICINKLFHPEGKNESTQKNIAGNLIFTAFRITYSYDIWPGTIPLQFSQPTEDLGTAADTLASPAHGGLRGCLA